MRKLSLPFDWLTGYSKPVALALIFAAVTLVGCGGGDDAGARPGNTGPDNSGVRQPLPPFTEDVLPVGDRVDLRSENYFPAQLADQWAYTRSPSVVFEYPPTPVSASHFREVTEVAGSEYTVAETGDDRDRRFRYRRTSDGIYEVGLLSDLFPAPVSQMLGSDLLVVPEPIYPAGSVWRIIRQGEWPEAIDDDGKPDSYRLMVLRRTIDFGVLTLPEDQLDRVAQFETRIELSLEPSDLAQPTRFMSYTQRTWWAPGIGLVQIEREISGIDGVGPGGARERLILADATISDQQAFPTPVDGTVVRVPVANSALVYDSLRNKYYATTPASALRDPNRVATINAESGAISYSSPLSGGDPDTLALASDSSALFVGLQATGEVIKVSLPDMTEVWRVPLPIEPGFGVQTRARELIASPSEPNTIAVSLERPGITGHAGLVLIKDGQLQPRTLSGSESGANIIFDDTGGVIYTYSSRSSADELNKVLVKANGLEKSQTVTLDVGPRSSFLSELAWSSNGIIFNNRLFSTVDYSLLGIANVGEGRCRELAQTGRLLCLNDNNVSSLAPRTVALVDGNSMQVLTSPIYQRGYEGRVFNEIVPGGPGQVGLRVAPDPGQVVPQAVWIFTSQRLQ